ncbi:hypothetical protein L9F63_022415, partial [Diploptera punctata]
PFWLFMFLLEDDVHAVCILKAIVCRSIKIASRYLDLLVAVASVFLSSRHILNSRNLDALIYTSADVT